MTHALSPAEITALKRIATKARTLHDFLSSAAPSENDPTLLLAYLNRAKGILGNLSNDISFLATILARDYLRQRFGAYFDATTKPQGAPGIDIDIISAEHGRIIGEIKTTKPYQPGFGAKQREEILKDLARLATTDAAYRFMFVSDEETFSTLCGVTFSKRAPGAEIVEVLSKQSFVCPTGLPESSPRAVSAELRTTSTGRKYDALSRYLKAQSLREIVLRFREIEEIIRFALPPSADRPQWWANTTDVTTMSPQRHACWMAGYDSFLISGSRKVQFRPRLPG